VGFTGIHHQCGLAFTTGIKQIHDFAARHRDAVGILVVGKHAQTQVQHNNQGFLPFLHRLRLFGPGGSGQCQGGDDPGGNQQYQRHALGCAFAGVEQVRQQTFVNDFMPGAALGIKTPQAAEEEQGGQQCQQPQRPQEVKLGQALHQG